MHWSSGPLTSAAFCHSNPATGRTENTKLWQAVPRELPTHQNTGAMPVLGLYMFPVPSGTGLAFAPS